MFSFTWPAPFVKTISNSALLPLLRAVWFLSCSVFFRLRAVLLKVIPGMLVLYLLIYCTQTAIFISLVLSFSGLDF